MRQRQSQKLLIRFYVAYRQQKDIKDCFSNLTFIIEFEDLFLIVSK